ncbi:MAG: carboxypeptidase-like regulatory domain-containing protein [bacterium]|nr:carboxypeptidase-like regulatory domain-containing protein [bacterium]
MRRVVWFLLVVSAVAALAALSASEDPRPTRSEEAASRRESTDARLAQGDHVTSAAAVFDGVPVPERAAVERELTAYQRLLRKASTGYTGRIVTARGEPVPGIGVALIQVAAIAALPRELDLFASRPVEPKFVLAEAETDGGGRFVLSGVPPRGICALRVAFEDPDSAPARFRGGQGTHVPVERAPAPGEVVDLGDIVLKVGATIVGRVTDPDGPVAGATVRAARLPPLPFGAVPIERLRPDGGLIGTPGGSRTFVEFPAWVTRVHDALPIARTMSQADGSFVLHGVDPGTVVVAATAPSRASKLVQNVAARAGEMTGIGDLFLGYGATTRVRVTDTAGQPVRNARVFVAPMSVGIPVHIAEPVGTTDGRGIVDVDGLPNGRAMAAAQRPGDAAWHIGDPANAEGTLRVVIPERHSLTLAIVDENEDPVPQPQLRFVAGDRDHGVLELSLFGARQPTDLSKRLRRLKDGRFRIDELDGGLWTVLVGAAGFASRQEKIDLRSDREFTIVLRRGRQLLVRAIDFEGQPVENATVYLSSRGGSRSERILEIPRPVGRTGEDGTYLVGDLPTAQTRITAEHPEHGQVHREVNGHPSELELPFAAPGSIAGILTDGGRPPAPGRWVLVLERRYGKGELSRGAMPEMPQLATPDLEGRFHFEALQPGRWRVTAQDSVGDISTVAGLVEYSARRKKIYPWNKAEVLLEGGDHADIQLDAIVDTAPWDGPGAFVRGSVMLNGAPAIGALVVGTSSKPDRRVTSRVEGAGWFELGKVPEGRLQLVVVSAAVADSRLKENMFSHLYSKTFDVVADRPIDATIRIETGVAFGFVTDHLGRPVDNCKMRLHDRGGDGRSSALRHARSEGGRFVFDQIPAGTYELRADCDQGSALRGGIVIPSGARVGPLDIGLIPNAEFSGQVYVDQRTPPRGTSLLLIPTAGGPPIRRRLDRDGTFEWDRVPAGQYRAEVQTAGRRLRAGSVFVVAPKTSDVTLYAPPR